MKQPTRPQRNARKDNVQKFIVEQPCTLIEAAQKALADHSASKIKSMLKHNQFAVNGMPSTKFNRPVEAGDELQVNYSGSFSTFSSPHLKLVYEDDDIIVVDKAYGVLSTSAGRNTAGTVYSIMRNYVKSGNERARVFVVHRLDRDTSGLMILARTAKAREKMVSNWSDIVSRRLYVAVVEGVMEKDSGTVRNFLIDDENNYEVHETDDQKLGQLAVTKYATLERGRRNSLVELEMRTGRKNQIRVHMKGLGHPVSGDRKYGGHSNPIRRLALHATLIEMRHPVTGQALRFESPVPDNFKTLL